MRLQMLFACTSIGSQASHTTSSTFQFDKFYAVSRDIVPGSFFFLEGSRNAIGDDALEVLLHEPGLCLPLAELLEVAGPELLMGKKNADEMLFWTNEEFKVFIEAMESRPVGYTVFMVMYYTGLRVGELLALTPEDIDFDRHIISVNKNYQRLNGKEYIYPPKTEKGYRDVVMPQSLETCIRVYMDSIFGLQPTDRIFPYDKSYMGRQMKYGCEKAGIQKIRVHGVRHTHASLLIDMGCTPLLVAERLGHEKVQTTLDTYAHLYPNKQNEVAAQLNEFMVNDDGYEKNV